MAKNFHVKSGVTGKPRDSLLSFRYIFVLGLLILVGSMSWLLWKKSELPVQLKSFTRNRVIRPIPPAPAQESMRVSLHIPERDGLQGTAVASVQEAMNSTAENDYVKQKNESKGNYVVEGSTSSSHDRGFVIQVGAFRRLARAENLQKALQDKGYDAYLETRTWRHVLCQNMDLSTAFASGVILVLLMPEQKWSAFIKKKGSTPSY